MCKSGYRKKKEERKKNKNTTKYGKKDMTTLQEENNEMEETLQASISVMKKTSYLWALLFDLEQKLQQTKHEL